MDSAYVPALAAFGGSAVGGLTSLLATWLTQRRTDRARRLTQEKTRRQKLYKQFIDERRNYMPMRLCMTNPRFRHL